MQVPQNTHENVENAQKGYRQDRSSMRDKKKTPGELCNEDTNWTQRLTEQGSDFHHFRADRVQGRPGDEGPNLSASQCVKPNHFKNKTEIVLKLQKHTTHHISWTPKRYQESKNLKRKREIKIKQTCHWKKYLLLCLLSVCLQGLPCDLSFFL